MAKNKVERYMFLKERLANIQEDSAKALGALEQEKARLKKDFGCDNLKQAVAEHARLKSEVEKDERLFEQKMAAFERKYPAVVE